MFFIVISGNAGYPVGFSRVATEPEKLTDFSPFLRYLCGLQSNVIFIAVAIS